MQDATKPALRSPDSAASGDRATRDGPEAESSVPVAIWILLLLTTSRWKRDVRIEGFINHLLQRLENEGWTVRTAHRRNYLLWRYGRTLRKTRFPILVLPSFPAGLATHEANLLLASECLRALNRVSGQGNGLDDASMEKLYRMQLRFRDPQRVVAPDVRSVMMTIDSRIAYATW
jgi:hypothetical protein